MSYCSSSRSGRAFFRYGEGAEDNVISRNPPLDYSLETIQLGGSGQVNCGIYRIKLRYNWLAPNGVPQVFFMWYSDQSMGDGLYREAICLQAPFIFQLQLIYSYNDTSVFFTLIGTPGSVYRNSSGQWQISSGYFCNNPNAPQETGFYGIQLEAKRNTTPTITVVEATWLGGNPEPPTSTACKFKVWDESGPLYERTEATCPIVRVECEGDCECLCEIVPIAHQIRERLRNL